MEEYFTIYTRDAVVKRAGKLMPKEAWELWDTEKRWTVKNVIEYLNENGKTLFEQENEQSTEE